MRKAKKIEMELIGRTVRGELMGLAADVAFRRVQQWDINHYVLFPCASEQSIQGGYENEVI